MNDISVKFSDRIKNLYETDVVYYSDAVNHTINAAFVIKVEDDTASILFSNNEIAPITFNSKDECWYYRGDKLHVLEVQ